MKILTIAATNSRVSINRALIDFATSRLQTELLPDCEIETIDLNDYEMPIYSKERQAEGGILSQAQAVFEKIGSVDAVVISFAEHNGSVSAAWKNIFDWMSRIDMKVWQGKPLLLLAATPGGRAGAGVLGEQEKMAPHFGADLRGVQGFGNWGDAFSAESGLVRAEDLKALDEALKGLIFNTVSEEESA